MHGFGFSPGDLYRPPDNQYPGLRHELFLLYPDNFLGTWEFWVDPAPLYAGGLGSCFVGPFAGEKANQLPIHYELLD